MASYVRTKRKREKKWGAVFDKKLSLFCVCRLMAAVLGSSLDAYGETFLFVGTNRGKIHESFSDGAIQSTSGIRGGFAGFNDNGTIYGINSYFNEDFGGRVGNDFHREIPKIQQELRRIETYTHSENEEENWDFDEIWTIDPDDNKDLPSLRWMMD